VLDYIICKIIPKCDLLGFQGLLSFYGMNKNELGERYHHNEFLIEIYRSLKLYLENNNLNKKKALLTNDQFD
jgi:hypothetical protein